MFKKHVLFKDISNRSWEKAHIGFCKQCESRSACASPQSDKDICTVYTLLFNVCQLANIPIKIGHV